MDIKFTIYSSELPHKTMSRILPDIVYMMMCRFINDDMPYQANISRETIEDIIGYIKSGELFPELVEDFFEASTSVIVSSDKKVALWTTAKSLESLLQFEKENPINHGYLYRYELDGIYNNETNT